MNEEELTYRIPNNQIHISKEKDEDCLIWISSKAINMANTVDELQQENQKYKRVINKLKEWINIVQQNKDNKHLEPFISTDELDELLDILKKGSQ